MRSYWLHVFLLCCRLWIAPSNAATQGIAPGSALTPLPAPTPSPRNHRQLDIRPPPRLAPHRQLGRRIPLGRPGVGLVGSGDRDPQPVAGLEEGRGGEEVDDQLDRL